MKLKFWKKKDEADDLFIDDDLKQPIPGIDDKFGLSTPADPAMPKPSAPSFGPPEAGRDFTVRQIPKQQFQQQQPVHGNDELILAKLDAIKAMVENVSRRLERIEEIALDEQKKEY